MSRLHKHRLYAISLIATGIITATALLLYALNQHIDVFLTPKQLAARSLSPTYSVRLGGIVKKDSIIRNPHNLAVQFIVTDFKQDITVHYTGVLPDLFREGKGVIATGKINKEGIFIAHQVLAKHDENYLPKNVYQAMRNAA